jgi:formamidopyrimidine-DNA glycosylase
MGVSLVPELPEVETSRRGLEPHLLGQRISGVEIRQPRLRWPVSAELAEYLPGQRLETLRRRGKYLIFDTSVGSFLLHLGMSGSLRVLPAAVAPEKHDHLDIHFGELNLRLRDPRRFAAVLWAGDEPLEHPLLRSLGPEPLESSFDAAWLISKAKGRRQAIKPFIMDSRILVGVGNIYASEALFRAGIHPERAAGDLKEVEFERLATAIVEVLNKAIAAGGTSLRDFIREDGRPGYFAQELAVYGRAGEPCLRCGEPIAQQRQAQRSSYLCPRCQQ